MKNIILLFCLLLPVILFAQFPQNGNKQRLGYQSTSDGLIWRGIAADTAYKPVGLTYPYFQLDTVNAILRRYIATKGKWQIVGGSGAPSGSAGGDLTGTYPNPSIANNSIISAYVLDGTLVNADLASQTIDSAKIKNRGVSPIKLGVAGATNSQVLKYNSATGTTGYATDNSLGNTNQTLTGSRTVNGGTFSLDFGTGSVGNMPSLNVYADELYFFGRDVPGNQYEFLLNPNYTQLIVDNAVNDHSRITLNGDTLTLETGDGGFTDEEGFGLIDKQFYISNSNFSSHAFQVDLPNRNIRLNAYGGGNKEAADISKTQSNYLTAFATDGTVLDLNIGAGLSISGGSLIASGGGGSGITALTGDVTASGTGSVAATIATSAVTSAKIANQTIDSLDMKNRSLTALKISPTGATNGQTLNYNSTSGNVEWSTPSGSTPSRVFLEGSTATSVDLDAGTTVKDRDGTNTTFTFPSNLSGLRVFKNGVLQRETGSITTRDYSCNTGTNTITFTTALVSTDAVIIEK